MTTVATVMSEGAPCLRVSNLSTSFMTERGRVTCVADVSFDIPSGQTLALVGESGSGKSVTSLGLMGLHAAGSQAIVGGEAWFRCRDGRSVDLLALDERRHRGLRGNELAMIFQEPMTSLNPVLTVGEQIAESARLHLDMGHEAARAHALRMLDLVEIPAAARRVKEYPHQLSGGMRQRVMIALAMACTPTLLIADEPTTALDVTIQAQILALIQRLQKETGMSVLFITHNLGVVAETADHVAVMYAGRIVEAAPVADLFARPSHPYTQACSPACPEWRRAAPQERHGRDCRRSAGRCAVPSIRRRAALLRRAVRSASRHASGRCRLCSPSMPCVGCAARSAWRRRNDKTIASGPGPRLAQVLRRRRTAGTRRR